MMTCCAVPPQGAPGDYEGPTAAVVDQAAQSARDEGVARGMDEVLATNASARAAHTMLTATAAEQPPFTLLQSAFEEQKDAPVAGSPEGLHAPCPQAHAHGSYGSRGLLQIHSAGHGWRRLTAWSIVLRVVALTMATKFLAYILNRTHYSTLICWLFAHCTFPCTYVQAVVPLQAAQHCRSCVSPAPDQMPMMTLLMSQLSNPAPQTQPHLRLCLASTFGAVLK